MKILNLYAGIGGNRKGFDWLSGLQVTAIENNEVIAEIYKKNFPNDEVIVADAHEYLRKNFRNYDFIWASPPCPTHSVLQMTRYYDENLKYPDMTLYQEILWLKSFYKGDWVIENVKPYYKPLIQSSFELNRHYFWSSKKIDTTGFEDNINYTKIRDNIKLMSEIYGFDLSKYKGKTDIRKALRNCVNPKIAEYICKRIY